MAPNRVLINEAADGVAAVFQDYRTSDGLDPPDRDSVLVWMEQFDESNADKAIFLKELISIYSKTYHPLERVRSNMKSIASQRNLVGADPTRFWETVDVLDIQSKGFSQSDLRGILAQEVKTLYNVDIQSHDGEGRHSLYLDDAIFSGNCVYRDIKDWAEHRVEPARLTIIALDVASGVEFSLKKRLEPEINVKPTVWHFTATDNRSNAGSKADVLRLRTFPTDEASQSYLQNRLQGGPAALLRGTSANGSSLFTDEARRELVELMFWRAGLKCLDECPLLSDNVRPLGYCSAAGQNKLGFGSLFASYRNCPNNAPVALWAGNPWIPLLRRGTN